MFLCCTLHSFVFLRIPIPTGHEGTAAFVEMICRLSFTVLASVACFLGMWFEPDLATDLHSSHNLYILLPSSL